MKHFPIFLALEGRRIVLSGGGDAALAKLRLLMKTQARLIVHASTPAEEIVAWADTGALDLLRRPVAPGDLRGAALFYAADEEAAEDARTTAIARDENVLSNIVDNLHDSQFITPAIVDRDPVTIAIGTEGTAPVLARAIKADLETRLPSSLGPLARAASAFRRMAEALPMGRARRSFWSEFFFATGPDALDRDAGADLRGVLRAQLATHLDAKPGMGRVSFAIVAAADPELLPLKTRNILHEADLVLHSAGVSPQILDLARREATFGALPRTARPLIDAATAGRHVICLMPAAPDARMIAACRSAGIAALAIPGIAPLPNLTPLQETA
ncbi:siroheme synthase [Roseovarius pelagicus]|uniref:precorrin-2 dehydrogenase n=1 Tax=Roseovarius pelagicus TaxID=2980108 RepID=A0ABY6DC28_9RHOB|nr:siroheme synthase [Roseovarius pelagicus]UXX83569.1 siroheme synthase [Roseovarius pelagicus]